MLKVNKKELKTLLDITNDKVNPFYVKIVNKELTVFNKDFSYSFELNENFNSKTELSYLFDEFKNFIKDSKVKNDIFLYQGKMIEKSQEGIIVQEKKLVSYPPLVEEQLEPITTTTASNFKLNQFKLFDKFKANLDQFPELNQTYITQLSDNALSFMVTNGYTFVNYDLPVSQRLIDSSDKLLVSSQNLKNIGIIFEKIDTCDIYYATYGEKAGLFFLDDTSKTVFISAERTSSDFFSSISQQFNYTLTDFSTISFADISKGISAYRKLEKSKTSRCLFVAKLSKNICEILDLDVKIDIDLEIPEEYLRNSGVIINAYDLVEFLKLDGEKHIGINDECISLKAGNISFIIRRGIKPSETLSD